MRSRPNIDYDDSQDEKDTNQNDDYPEREDYVDQAVEAEWAGLTEERYAY